MHDCFQLPPEHRCGFCRGADAAARRMAGNSIRTAAWDRNVPDDEWCALLRRCGIDMVALFLKERP